MSAQPLTSSIERVESALAAGDLDRAIDAIATAAGRVDGDADPALLARLSWAAASISLASGDGAGFIARALEAIELAAEAGPARGEELAAVAAALGRWGKEGADGPVAIVAGEGDGAPLDAIVLSGASGEARVRAARALAAAAAPAVVVIDGARVTPPDLDAAIVLARLRGAAIVVAGAIDGWLADLAETDRPLVIATDDDGIGRAAALVRRGRGRVEVREIVVARAPGLDGWDLIGEARRCAAVVGPPEEVAALAQRIAARAGAPLVAIDLAAGVSPARTAIAAAAPLVLLDGAATLSAGDAIALAALIDAGRSTVLLSCGAPAELPPGLAAACDAILDAGDAR